MRWTGAGITNGTVYQSPVTTAQMNAAGNGDTIAVGQSGTYTVTKTADGLYTYGTSGSVFRLDGTLPTAGRNLVAQARVSFDALPSTLFEFGTGRTASAASGWVYLYADNKIGLRTATQADILASKTPVAINPDDVYQIDVIIAVNTGTPSTTNGRMVLRVKDITDPTWNSGSEWYYDTGYTTNAGTVTSQTIMRWGKIGTAALANGAGITFGQVGWDSLATMNTSTDPTVTKAQFMPDPAASVARTTSGTGQGDSTASASATAAAPTSGASTGTASASAAVTVTANAAGSGAGSGSATTSVSASAATAGAASGTGVASVVAKATTNTAGGGSGVGAASAGAAVLVTTTGSGSGDGSATGQQKQIVAVESYTNGFQQTVNAGTSLTFTHTVNAGVTVLVVAVQASASSGLSTAATCYYAGQALTRVSSALSSSASTAREAAIFVLVNPPVGTAQVQVPARSSGTTYTIGATAISLTGASGDVGTAASTGAASVTSISGTTVSNPGDLVITSGAIRSTTQAAGGGGTVLFKTVYGTNNAFNTNALPGGNNTSTYTWSTADQAALTSMPMSAANGSGPVNAATSGTGSGDGTATAVVAASSSATGASSGTGTALAQQRATTGTSGAGVGSGVATAQAQVARTAAGSGSGTGTSAGSATAQVATAGTGAGAGAATGVGMAMFTRTTTGDGTGSGTTTATSSTRATSTSGGTAGTGIAVALVAASTTTAGGGTGAGTATAVLAVTATTSGNASGSGATDATSVTYLLVVVSGTSNGDGTAIGGPVHPFRDVTVTILGPYHYPIPISGPLVADRGVVGPYCYPTVITGPMELA